MTLRRILRTNDIPGYLLVRVILGYVFLVAGLQKFFLPDEMGPGRFADLGFPEPALVAYAVGAFEVLGGALILVGLATRLAAVPLAAVMVVAIAVTKLPDIGDGFWDFAHGLRLDLAMLLLAVFVVINGADRRSVDHRLTAGASPGDQRG